MPKYSRPTAALTSRRRGAGAIETVVTFGSLVLQFQNEEQSQVVVTSKPEDPVQEVWVSCARAVRQIERRLEAYGYGINPHSNPISNWAEEKWHWLPLYQKCNSCKGRLCPFGSARHDNHCPSCSTPTKNNTTEVYVAKGAEVPVRFDRILGYLPLDGK